MDKTLTGFARMVWIVKVVFAEAPFLRIAVLLAVLLAKFALETQVICGVSLLWRRAVIVDRIRTGYAVMDLTALLGCVCHPHHRIVVRLGARLDRYAPGILEL